MDDDTTQPTPDDALEEARQDPSLNDMGSRLPEDDANPASPATDLGGRSLPPDHPAFDTDRLEQAEYDEGRSTGTGINDLEEVDSEESDLDEADLDEFDDEEDDDEEVNDEDEKDKSGSGI